MKVRHGTLVACVLIAGLPFEVSAQRARLNHSPLGGLKGYYVHLVTGVPQTQLEVGVKTNPLKARLEVHLKDKGLLGSAAEGDTVGRLHVDVDISAPKDGYYAWHVRLEVRESVRLDRAPDAGSFTVDSWHGIRHGVALGQDVRSEVECALDELASDLARAHASGGGLPPY